MSLNNLEPSLDIKNYFHLKIDKKLSFYFKMTDFLLDHLKKIFKRFSVLNFKWKKLILLHWIKHYGLSLVKHNFNWPQFTEKLLAIKLAIDDEEQFLLGLFNEKLQNLSHVLFKLFIFIQMEMNNLIQLTQVEGSSMNKSKFKKMKI